MKKLNAEPQDGLFEPWFENETCSVDAVEVLKEREGGRKLIFDSLVETSLDHVVGLKAIEKLGGFAMAKHVLKHRVPDEKKARSGMLGEILMSEYVQEKTDYSIPVRRLQYRETRDLAMRGNDGLGFRKAGSRFKVLKIEAKSRLKLATAHVTKAREGLAQHRGRPNPETLAYLACHLLSNDRDKEAEPVTFLLNNPIYVKDVDHLLFTLSGNAPKGFLEANSDKVQKGIDLRLCGLFVSKHKDFVKAVFDGCMARS